MEAQHDFSQSSLGIGRQHEGFREARWSMQLLVRWFPQQLGWWDYFEWWNKSCSCVWKCSENRLTCANHTYNCIQLVANQWILGLLVEQDLGNWQPTTAQESSWIWARKTTDVGQQLVCYSVVSLQKWQYFDLCLDQSARSRSKYDLCLQDDLGHPSISTLRKTEFTFPPFVADHYEEPCANALRSSWRWWNGWDDWSGAM